MPTILRNNVTAWTLLLLACGLGLGSYFLFPHDRELPTSPPSRISVVQDKTAATARFPVTFIDYSVSRVRQRQSLLRVGVILAPTGRLTDANQAGDEVLVSVNLPQGVRIASCRPPACTSFEGAYTWSKELVTEAHGAAYAELLVNDAQFGFTSAGPNGSVAIPAVNYSGPGRPSLQARYYIPSADRYEWASDPPLYTSPTAAEWSEYIEGGAKPQGALVLPRAAAGLDREKQESRDRATFLAGALIALAGAALIASLQEMLKAPARQFARARPQ